MEHQSLREEVARIARSVSVSGLVTGTSGNVSARTPEGHVLVTPSGLDYAFLEPEDVVLVDPEGRVLEGSLAPSSEMPMHAGIYRSKPRVGSIVHTHARFSTALACLGWEIPPVHYMLVVLSGEGRVPLAPYATYGTEELARHATDALGDSHHACLLRNHGTIAVGGTASEAFSRTEILEEMAEIYYRARLAGEPVLLTSEQVNEA
ncbi:MAG: class II aldolase/adducin family protein, partial [Actinomycetota bacterium]|nr:class II aldolase/adducin family protein [Actinomycetota bacterium]